MPQTPNHGYNVPNQGDQNWHQPLNDNFEQYDTDIEIRDAEGSRGNYDPKAGAKFYATDTGRVYLGDGSTWNPVANTGPEPTLSAINTGDADLGVGTASPATKLHVADDPATTGAMDPSRVAALIENTSGASNGDMLGLKTQVSNPGQNVDFISFLGGDSQLGQFNGNGSNGLRLASSGPLRLGAEDRDLRLESAADGLRLELPTPGSLWLSDLIRLDQDRETTFIDEGTLGVEGGGQVHGDDDAIIFSKGQNTFFVENSMVATYRADLHVDGELTATNKNFLHTAETPDGEKEVTYTSTEAPTARTEVSGVAALEDGRVEVDLPDHFGWVTDDDEPIVVQVTPHAGEPVRPQVTTRSPERIVVQDVADDGATYEVSYTVRGTREGYADEQVVREPSTDRPGAGAAPAPGDD